MFILKKDSPCSICKATKGFKFEKGKTPQGWPMKVRICPKDGERILLNNPKADHIKELEKEEK